MALAPARPARRVPRGRLRPRRAPRLGRRDRVGPGRTAAMRPEPATVGRPRRGGRRRRPAISATPAAGLAGSEPGSDDFAASRLEASASDADPATESTETRGRSSPCWISTSCCAYAVERGASDVHIKVGSPPFIRVDGRLERIDHADGLAGRDRAHRVRDHAEAARRGVHRVRARPTSRTRCRASAASAST